MTIAWSLRNGKRRNTATATYLWILMETNDGRLPVQSVPYRPRSTIHCFTAVPAFAAVGSLEAAQRAAART